MRENDERDLLSISTLNTGEAYEDGYFCDRAANCLLFADPRRHRRGCLGFSKTGKSVINHRRAEREALSHGT